jgi:hypothetical protein
MAELVLEDVELSSVISPGEVARAQVAAAAEMENTVVKRRKVKRAITKRGVRAKGRLPKPLHPNTVIDLACIKNDHAMRARVDTLLESRPAVCLRPYCDECWKAFVAAHKSLPEAKVHYVLRQLVPRVEFLPNERPDFTYEYDARGYEFDLYAPSIRIAVEVHGPQHYDPTVLFVKDRPRCYQQILERDLDRRWICRREDVELISVPHNAPDLPRLLRRELLWARAFDDAARPTIQNETAST